MKRLRRILIIAIILFVGGIAVQRAANREPHYQGKALSSWLEGYDIIRYPGDASKQKQADAAMRHAGTNAIPTLLRMLREEDSPLKLKALGLLRKQSFIKINSLYAQDRNYVAGVAFHILGDSASNAVPDLISIYHRQRSDPARNAVAIALSSFGPVARDAVPLLLAATTNQDYCIRCNSVDALAHIHAQPDLTIPVLIQCLGTGDSDIRKSAAHGLGAFGTAAKKAVPNLLQLLTNTDQGMRIRATNAIIAIDPEAAEKAGIYKNSPEVKPATGK